MTRQPASKKYSRKSHPTKFNGRLYPSYSEAILARTLHFQGVPHTYSPRFTWKKKGKPFAYHPDFVFDHKIHPVGIPWPVEAIEVKGVTNNRAIWKLHCLEKIHQITPIILTLEFFEYWDEFGMFLNKPIKIPDAINPSRLDLRRKVFQKLTELGIPYVQNPVLAYDDIIKEVDIVFPQTTQLPGILFPIDYLHIIDDAGDFDPQRVWLQRILKDRDGKVLFFATRTYVDYWLSINSHTSRHRR